MYFLDLCAGIGGFRLGMERAGHECVGYVEIDRYARQSYEAMFNTKWEFTAYDITAITNEQLRALGSFRKIDIICGGFPCQPFSTAGKRKGFEDGRGTIIFHFCRFLREIRPPWFVFENVKGLLSHDGGATFRTILRALTELGYCVEWKLLNSKDYGVPQSRERVYIVGHFGGPCGGKIFFDTESAGENPNTLEELTKGAPDSYRVYDSGGLARTLKAEGGGVGAKTGLYLCNVTETKDRDEAGRKIWEMRNAGIDYSGTITATYYKGGVRQHGGAAVVEEKRIRRLTPRECWRLQGFPDEMFDRAAATGLSDTQLYKQAGNAVTVNVVEWIGKRIAELEAEK